MSVISEKVGHIAVKVFKAGLSKNYKTSNTIN